MTKTAKQILFEHGINIMELNDDFNTQLLHAMEAYASQPSAGLEIDTFPFCERGGKWFYCYKDIKGLNQHSKLFDSWGEAIQSYSEWYFVKADDLPAPSAGLGEGEKKLIAGASEFLESHAMTLNSWEDNACCVIDYLKSIKALTSLPSGKDEFEKLWLERAKVYEDALLQKDELINQLYKPTIDARQIASDAMDKMLKIVHDCSVGDFDGVGISKLKQQYLSTLNTKE